jgi:hypothetical protein
LLKLPGMTATATKVDLSLSAKDVGGVIMPPGMVMDFDTPADAMRDMGVIHPRYISYTAPVGARGDQVLRPRIEKGCEGV